MFSYSVYQIFLFILVIFKLESAYIILSFVIWYFISSNIYANTY